MKKIFLIILSVITFTFSSQSFAQKVTINQIIKEKEDGEIKGCGIEVIATDGMANGIQMQAILYSLGNLNWSMAIHLIAGTVDEQNEFVQSEIRNASILGKAMNEIHVVKNGKYIAPESLEKMYVVGIVRQMLASGFSVSFQTRDQPDGYIEIPASEEKFKEYSDGCYSEMAGMLREHYRKIHGDTKCLDKPESC